MHSSRRRALKSIAALSGSILVANRLPGSPAGPLVEEAAASASPRCLPPPWDPAREITSRSFDFSDHPAVSNLKLDEAHVKDVFTDALGGEGLIVQMVGDVEQNDPRDHDLNSVVRVTLAGGSRQISKSKGKAKIELTRNDLARLKTTVCNRSFNHVMQ